MSINILMAFYSHFHLLIPALDLIETKFWNTQSARDKTPLEDVKEFITLLPAELDGDLGECIDPVKEQLAIHYLKEHVDEILSNLYDIEDSFHAWNIGYDHYIYPEYQDCFPDYLAFTSHNSAREKHYINKAQRFLNGEKDLSEGEGRK